MNGQPIWLNASFVVTVEPTRSGGAIVVPIGDGLDYEVRETPETVLALLAGAPAPTVVPVPPPRALAPQPEDVSPEEELPADPEPEKPMEETKPAKRGRRRKKNAEQSSAVSSATMPAKKETSRTTDPPEPEGFREIVADLKARKCRTGKRLRNAIKSYFKKTDEIEIDHIIETMINRGYMLVGADGHVTWIENPS